MKRLIFIVFISLTYILFASGDNTNFIDSFKDFDDKEEIELFTAEEKDKLLILRREYFIEIKKIQEKGKELRKEANECMIKNDEKRYEEIHDKMNELKFQREKAKENYRKKVKEILE